MTATQLWPQYFIEAHANLASHGVEHPCLVSPWPLDYAVPPAPSWLLGTACDVCLFIDHLIEWDIGLYSMFQIKLSQVDNSVWKKYIYLLFVQLNF